MQNLFGLQIQQSIESQAAQRLDAKIGKMKAEVKALKNAPSGTRYEDLQAKNRWEVLEAKITSLSGRTHERQMALQDEIITIQTEARAAQNAVFSEFNEIQAELQATEAALNEQIDGLMGNLLNYAPGALTKSELRRIAGRLLTDDTVETDSKGRKFTRVQYGNSGKLRITLNSEGSAMAVIAESRADSDGE